MIALPLDKFLVTEENRETYERVKGLTAWHDAPERLFMVGPAESGKTMLMRARWQDRDLLSSKKVLYRRCANLVKAFNGEIYDEQFDTLDQVDVLMLDDFGELFWNEMGPRLAALLLQQRVLNGVDTLIASRKPLCDFDLSEFNGMFENFESIELPVLQPEDRPAYVRRLLEEYVPANFTLETEHEAIDRLARDASLTLTDLRFTVKNLVEDLPQDAGEGKIGVVDVEKTLDASHAKTA